jgi:WD40 repeat protein
MYSQGGADLTFRVWDLKEGKSVIVYGHCDNIISTSVSKNFLCSSGGDARLRVWHFEL